MALPGPTYTGQNTGVVLDDGGQMERARTGMMNKYMAAAQTEAQFNKEERDAFLEALDTETVALMSENLLGQQAAMIESYNKKYGDVWRKRKGRLTMEDKVQMQADKKRLEGWQKQKLVDQERWRNDKYRILNDRSGYYDKEAFYEAEAHYLETGEYPVGALQAVPVGLETIIAEQRQRTKGLRPKQRTIIQTIDGIDFRVPYESTADLDDPENEALMRKWTYDLIMSDERALRGAMRDFNKEDQAVKNKYLDVNKDGKVDERERQATNPIVQWAIDRNWKLWSEESYGTPTKITDTSYGSTIWNGKKVFPQPDQSLKIGEVWFNKFHSLGGNLGAGSLTIPETAYFLDENETRVSSPKAVTNLDIVGYDEDRQAVIVAINKDIQLGGWWKDNNIAIPIYDLPDFYKDLPIVVNGQPTTVRKTIGGSSGKGGISLFEGLTGAKGKSE